jgi:endonuclease-8
MPEGPEVRREADRISRAIAGRQLEDVYFGLPRLRRFGPLLAGTEVEGVEAKGKALLIRFSSGQSLYSHNQLYGKWVVQKRSAPLNPRRTLRVGLHVREHSALLYSASEIEVMDRGEEDRHPYLRRLGPDVLSDTVHWRDVASRLQSEEFAGRQLASLYLDQHFLAGVGNYLRSEILFDAGLPPKVRPRDLSRAESGRLARSTLTICRRAYETAGVTNHPPLVKRLKKAGAARRDYRFAVFAREGLPCYQCGTTIERIEAGSRRLYLCPSCQPTERIDLEVAANRTGSE